MEASVAGSSLNSLSNQQSLLGPAPPNLPRNPAIKIGTNTRRVHNRRGGQQTHANQHGGRNQAGPNRDMIPSLLGSNFPHPSADYQQPHQQMAAPRQFGLPQQQVRPGQQGQGQLAMGQSVGMDTSGQGGQGLQRPPPGSAAEVMYKKQLEKYYAAHYARSQQMRMMQHNGAGGNAGMAAAGHSGGQQNMVKS